MHHVPQKDNDATNFLAKLVARRAPSPVGVFINDLHESSACILGGPIQTHFDSNSPLEGSDPSISMATSSTDVAVVTFDPVDWRAHLLAYLLEEVLPPERTKARRIIAIDDKLY